MAPAKGPRRSIHDSMSSSKGLRHRKAGSPPQSPATGIPLRAWPSRGGHWAEVPEVLGLDEYGYDVGARLAARAETRFAQEILQETQPRTQRCAPAPSHEPRTARRRPASATGVSGGSSSRGQELAVGPEARKHRSNQCFVEAGGQGNAVILWNSSGKSTDDGSSQLQKRRQKLTDDMLKEIVVSNGDSFRSVSWWFHVFEFYCDRPVDMALPALPQAHEELAATSHRSKSEPRLATNPTTVSAGAAKDSTAMGEVAHESVAASTSAQTGGPPAATKVRPASAARERPFSANAASKARPMLREIQAGRKPGVPPAPRVHLNEPLWNRRNQELRRFRQALKNIDGAESLFDGDLDLAGKCKVEHLDDDKIEAWVSGYTNALQKALCSDAQTGRKTLAGDTDEVEFDSWGEKRESHLKHAVDRMKDRMRNMSLSMFTLTKAVEAQKQSVSREDSSVSDSSSDHCVNLGGSIGTSGLALALGGSVLDAHVSVDAGAPRMLGEKGAATELDTTAVLLRTSSRALLSSTLLQKAKTGSNVHPELSTDDILARRAAVLGRVEPVKMTPDNLYRALSCFGLARRKAVDRIFAFLLRSCPGSPHSRKGKGLQFEVFYQFMKALFGGKLAAPRQNQKRSTGAVGGAWSGTNAPGEIKDAHAAAAMWQESDLLMRLLFSLLTGRLSNPPSSAAERRVADSEGISFPIGTLKESLRLLICTPVLLEVDRGSISQGAHCMSASSSSATAGEGFSGDAVFAEGSADGADGAAAGLTFSFLAQTQENQSSCDDQCDPSSSGAATEGEMVSMVLVDRARRNAAKPDELVAFVNESWVSPFRTQFSAFIECLHAALLNSEANSSGRLIERLEKSPVLSFGAFQHFVSEQPTILVALMHLFLPMISRGANLMSEEIDLTHRQLTQRAGELRARMEVHVQRLQRKQMARLHQEFTLPQFEGKICS